MSEITAIGKTNLGYYAPFLSEHIYDNVSEEDHLFMYGIESEEGMAVGAAAIRQVESWAEIVWFAVGEEFRGRGHGQSAFDQILMELKDMGVANVTMRLSMDADQRLVRLLQGYSFTEEAQDECMLLTRTGILTDIEYLKHKTRRAVSLSSVSDQALKGFGDMLVSNQMDYIPLPVQKSDYWAEASTVYLENGVPKAMLLLKQKKNKIHVPFMASLSKNPLAIMELFCVSVNVLRNYPRNTVITMNLADRRMVPLMRYFFKNIDPSCYKIFPVKEYEISLLKDSMKYRSRISLS